MGNEISYWGMRYVSYCNMVGVVVWWDSRGMTDSKLICQLLMMNAQLVLLFITHCDVATHPQLFTTIPFWLPFPIVNIHYPFIINSFNSSRKLVLLGMVLPPKITRTLPTFAVLNRFTFVLSSYVTPPTISIISPGCVVLSCPQRSQRRGAISLSEDHLPW